MAWDLAWFCHDRVTLLKVAEVVMEVSAEPWETCAKVAAHLNARSVLVLLMNGNVLPVDHDDKGNETVPYYYRPLGSISRDQSRH